MLVLVCKSAFFTFKMLSSSVIDIIMIILLVPSFNTFLDKLFPIQSIISGLPVSSGVGRRWHLLCLRVSAWPEAALAWGGLLSSHLSLFPSDSTDLCPSPAISFH